MNPSASEGNVIKQDVDAPPQFKRARFHRHTIHQVQVLESDHPSAKSNMNSGASEGNDIKQDVDAPPQFKRACFHRRTIHQVQVLESDHPSAKSNMNSSASEDNDIKQEVDAPPQFKRARFHRHAIHQVQVLESFFKDYPHPKEAQRRELAQELGMEPLQVKFWFQNKRNQMKLQHEQWENMELHAVNEKLRSDNIKLKKALAVASCVGCGRALLVSETTIEEVQTKMENDALRKEILRISAMAAMYAGKSFTAPSS